MGWLQEMLQQQGGAGGAPAYVTVDEEGWTQTGRHLAAGEASLLSLWGDTNAVAMAVLEGETIAVLTLPCPTGRFPSIGRLHPPALRLERTIRDLCGLQPFAGPDTRRWLDHGRWGVRQPLGRNDSAPATGDAYAFHDFPSQETTRSRNATTSAENILNKCSPFSAVAKCGEPIWPGVVRSRVIHARVAGANEVTGSTAFTFA